MTDKSDQYKEFALEKWVNKQGWRIINKCYVTHKLIRSDYPGPHIHDELGHYHRPPTIDLDFIRELPIEDEGKYLDELVKIVCQLEEGVNNLNYKRGTYGPRPITINSWLLMKLINAKPEPRLEAYHNSQIKKGDNK